MQRSLVLLKPDCVQRGLIGEVIARFEKKGLTIVAMKMLKVTPDLAKQHYAEHVEKPFYPSLESFITSAPIVALALDGLQAISVIRDMLGATSGLKAAAGTIRGDFSGSQQMNLVHASDGEEAAARELALYFNDEDFCDFEPVVKDFLRAADEG
ncbi:MAG: nucleoside-diphosphate kinase [Planctomycetota bacterium]